MYTKLFAKILDSSIWIEPSPTRIVWITLLAAMDKDGYAHFSTVENLANRARVSKEDAGLAVTTLMAPDKNSENPENEGRRIDRVPGGFIVLNASLYRLLRNEDERREYHRKYWHKRVKTQHDSTILNKTQPDSTHTDTDTEREEEVKTKKTPPTELKSSSVGPPQRGAPKKASRLIQETLPDDWRTWATKECAKKKCSLDADETWAIFRDYWIAQPEQKGVKLDWAATWRNWVRKEIGRIPKAKANTQPPIEDRLKIDIPGSGRPISEWT